MTNELIIAKSAINNLTLQDALTIKSYLKKKMPELQKAHEDNCKFQVGERVLVPSGLRGYVCHATIKKLNLVSALVDNGAYSERVRYEYIQKIPENNSCGF